MTPRAASTVGPVTGRAAIRAQLEAGRAAVVAGALDAGLDCLRRAVAEARAASADALQAEALVALGSALVHAARGRDEEGASALHRALGLSTDARLASTAAAAARELGYVEFLRGRYTRAQAWAKRALALADDDAEHSRARCVLGSALTDVASYERGIDELRQSEALSSLAEDTRQTAYTLSMLGRAHLLRRELPAAVAALDQSLVLARRDGWTAFVAWPEALRGDVDLVAGDVDAAAERYEYAFALGCQLEDPCWEGIAARGLARVATWIDELATLAARTGMRELTVRAHAHRGRLGDEASAEVARVLEARIDSQAVGARALPDRPSA